MCVSICDNAFVGSMSLLLLESRDGRLLLGKARRVVQQHGGIGSKLWCDGRRVVCCFRFFVLDASAMSAPSSSSSYHPVLQIEQRGNDTAKALLIASALDE